MTQPKRIAILPRLGLTPTVPDLVRKALDESLVKGDYPTATALDAGCGQASLLVPYRERLRRFVGADIHRPTSGALRELDEFIEVDLCEGATAFQPQSFDVVLSSFTIEHFRDPSAALRNIRGWLRPGGRLILTTVNRRHPFVAAYLGLPHRLRRRLQVFIKSTPADAHPLVGACNSTRALRDALVDAGFVEIKLFTAPHLARAWVRRWPTFVLGVLGDLAAKPFASMRSTIVASAIAPAHLRAEPATATA